MTGGQTRPPREWLIFMADWCPACDRLRGLLRDLEAEATVTLVDIDADADRVERYGVTVVPTLIRLSGDQVVGKIVGLPSRNLARAS